MVSSFFQNACIVYKNAYLNTLLFLHFAFMLCMVKMPLKGEVGGSALDSHGNFIVDRRKSWKNHGIVLLNFFGDPVMCTCCHKCTQNTLWGVYTVIQV